MSSRTPEARRAARAATQPQPTLAERARAQLAAGLPGARPVDLDVVAEIAAGLGAGFDLAAAVADLAAIWCGETPEDRGDRHAIEDRERADRWWRSRLAADGIGIRSGAPRAEAAARAFRARKWASANAAALRPRMEVPSAIAV